MEILSDHEQPNILDQIVVEAVLSLTESDELPQTKEVAELAFTIRRQITHENQFNRDIVLAFLGQVGFGPEVEITFEESDPFVCFYTPKLSLAQTYHQQNG